MFCAVQGDSALVSAPVPVFNAKDWAAAFSSQPGEFDYWIEEVEGAIPECRGRCSGMGPATLVGHPSHWPLCPWCRLSAACIIGFEDWQPASVVVQPAR